MVVVVLELNQFDIFDNDNFEIITKIIVLITKILKK